MSYFRVTQGPEEGRIIPLAQGSTTFGRSSDNNVILNEQTVSRHHARVEIRGEQIFLTDLGTSNGTLVNAQRIGTVHPLRPGDVVQMGTVVMRLENQPLAGDAASRSSPGMGVLATAPRGSTRPATVIRSGSSHISNQTYWIFAGLGAMALIAILLILLFAARGTTPIPAATLPAAALTVTAVAFAPNPAQQTTAPETSQAIATPSGTAPLAIVPLETAGLPNPEDTPSATLPARRNDKNQILKHTVRNGLGQLKIQNNYSQDLVALITDQNLKTQMAVYVRSSEQALLDKIKNGTYGFYFVLGTDWDEKQMTFTRDQAYYRFEQKLTFSTQQVQGGQQFTTFDVLLGSNVSGLEKIENPSATTFPSVK